MEKNTIPLNGFKVISRSGSYKSIPISAAQDERLSYKARGVLFYLLSHKDGRRGQIYNIKNSSDKDGLVAVRSAMKELVSLGYAKLKKQIGKGGKFAGSYYEISGTLVPKQERPSERKIAYDEDLRSDKWKRFRERVLKRDGYACTKCGARGVILNAHHTYYFKGRYHAWEYPLDALVTLCEDCHNAIHNELKKKGEYIPLITNPDKTDKRSIEKKGDKTAKPRLDQKIPARIQRKLKEAKKVGRVGRGKNCLAYAQQERMRRHADNGQLC